MKKLFSTMLLATVLLSGYAQTEQQDTAGVKNEKKEKKLYLYGYLSDAFTRSHIPDVKVVLLRPDSTLVDSAHVDNGGWHGIKSSEWYLQVPAKPAKFIIKATAPDYETTYKNYEIKYVARNRQFEVPAIHMRRIQRTDYDKDGGELGEVVVKATKVKMVYKGDTIVFNADAFNIPEGSMLDGLIKQLPGVELKDNGEIYVNGKKVENLTLNGADFFKGKNKMMLENLPYYTVKNVQVFNKRTPKSEFLGRDEEEKVFTMDVQLKKEYTVGGSVNLEAGYGTDDRYKVRGFGMRFTDRTRAVLFGGANNLNEYIDYDREGNERDRTQASGDRDVESIGGMFSWHAPEERITNDMEFKLQWQDIHSESKGQSENYLAGASTFGQSQSINNNRIFDLNLRNTFYVRKPVYIYSWIDLDYAHSQGNGEGWSLTANDQLMKDSINHTWSRNMQRENRLSLNMTNLIDVKLPWGDMLEFQMTGYLSRQWNNGSFSQNRYTLYNTGTVDQRNQYGIGPSKNYDLNGEFRYSLQLTENLSISPRFNIGYQYYNYDNNNYRLDWLGPNWAVGGPNEMGMLPSTADSLALALDAPNSSEQSHRINRYGVGGIFSYNKSSQEGYKYFYLMFDRNFNRKHMNYYSDVLNSSMDRDYNYWKFYTQYYTSFAKNRKNFSIYAQNSLSMPNISQLVDITTTSNPLYVRKGNPDLKPQTYWYFNTRYSARVDSLDQNFSISLNGNLSHNAITTAYTYDPTTGIRTTWSENVNGNWNASTNLDFTRALGKKKFWHISNNLNFGIGQSTDMSSVQSVAVAQQQTTEPQRNRVTTTRLSYSPNVRYQKEKLSFTLLGNVSWQHIHRSIEVTEMPTDVYDFSYGFNANYKLPWNFTIDTDLQMHSRRGYADSQMNDNRLYWDATLTKSWKQGRWIAKLKGYDILGRVSQWQYYVNAQGRTETWTNNMRRYILLSLAYRFSLTPKKQ
ncbi:MAG: outer membrane beta-barrel protein [Prevotella sp.]|nr:outer membrane beta-barrel protein [Prevotella sp.]